MSKAWTMETSCGHPLGRALLLLFAAALIPAVAPAARAELLDVEKDELTLGFIKLTDMAPLAIAQEMGFFEEEGLYARSSRRPTGRCCSTG